MGESVMLRVPLLSLTIITIGATSALADRMSACRNHALPDQQARACSDVIDQKPETDVLASAWTHRGQAYARKGMTREAADNFSQAIRIKPNHASAWIGRGQARLVERRFDEAITDYSKAIKLSPKDGSIYVARGYAYLVKNESKRAINDFTKALGIEPTDAVALNNRGLAYRKLGQHKRALADYTAAIQARPLYALAYNNRGYVHETMGNKPKAVDDFQTALDLDPSLVGARDALVRLSAASDLAALSTKRIADGKSTAKKSCAWCHAIGPRGDSPNKDAPRFRDIHMRHPILTLREPISRAIATPHDKMPKLPLSNAQVDQIIAYINSLRPAK
jgi:tetratricopeptide (TPR) repeat protein